MHTRIVAAVAAVLFVIMAAISFLVVDLRDRSLPVALDAGSVVTLETRTSSASNDQLLAEIVALSDGEGLGLYRIAPDLTAGEPGEVFVAMTARQVPPGRTIPRFGDQPDAVVLGVDRLDHSLASGRYVMTGPASGEDVLDAWARRADVQVSWAHDGVRANLAMLASQPTLLTASAAAVLLMVVIVVYWFAVRARGRALRVLGGVPARRIQRDDLVRLARPVVAAGVTVGAALVLGGGVLQGWVFAPVLAVTYGWFAGAVVVATVVGALAVSAASWPTPRMIAERLPAVGALRAATGSVRVVSLVLVLASVSPAVAAYQDARASAAEQAQWRVLADVVALALQGGETEDEWKADFEQPVSDVVREAHADGRAALSYYVPPDVLAQYAPDDTGYGLALVDARWLDLFHRTTSPLPDGAADPPAAREFLVESLPLWLDSGVAPADISFRVASGSPLPVVRGGAGELEFPEKTVLYVVDGLDAFTDDWVASLASTSNVVLQGLTATIDAVAEHHLTGRVQVRYIAEEGLLRAHLTAFLAWLALIALLALLVSLVVATAVAAFISAVTVARRDFPILLTGAPPGHVVARRAAREIAGAGAVTAVVVAVVVATHSPGPWLVAGAGLLVTVLVPAVHRGATQRMFGAVVRRAL